MSSYLLESNTALYTMADTGVATAISLPAGITLLSPSIPIRAALYGSGDRPYIVVVNGLTHDIYIDTFGTAMPLSIQAPSGSPTLSAGAGTGLTGEYVVAVSYKVKDNSGYTILESELGPISAASASLSNQSLRLDAIPVSNDPTVTARGIYRSLTGGTTLYPWFDIDDNVTLSEDRGVADSLISLIQTTATNIGQPPDFSHIVTWKDRLWAVPRYKIDSVRWTEEDQFYAWNATNELIAEPKNTDTFGVTAFIPRRDQLGVARYDKLYQITGDDNDTFTRTAISNTIGCVSQESVVVVRDVAYWLGERGVVEWSASSLTYCSEAQVNPWFVTDNYFNRSMFSKAQGRYNPDTDSYELHLASLGSSELDQWVSFDLRMRRWFGPHLTNAFTPTVCGNSTSASGTLTDSNDLPISVVGGSDGYLYFRDKTNLNDYHSPIPFNVNLPLLGDNDPDTIKAWGQLTIHTEAEPSGTLTITPTVGDIADPPQAPLYHDLTIERERLARLGIGRYLQLNLQHNAMNETVRVYGVTIPYAIAGIRS